MLTAYLDESGHEGEGYVFVAGFLGDDAGWRRCEKDWKLSLGQRPHFHAHDLRWSNPRAERLLARLGPIPRQSGLRMVLGGVKVADYADLVSGTPAEIPLKGYVVALFPLIMTVLGAIPENETVEFVFEEQRQYQDLTSLVFETINNLPIKEGEALGLPVSMFFGPDGKTKITKWRQVPKDSTVLAEPADYLVFALTQFYRNRHSKKSRWCMPIIGDKKAEAIGHILTREEARISAIWGRIGAGDWPGTK